LTRQNVIDAAMLLVNENTTQLMTPTVQTTFADMANRHVYDLIVAKCSHYVVTSTSFTWPANTESADFTGASYLNADPLKLISIEDYPSTGGIGAGNLPRKWETMESSQRPGYHYQWTVPHYIMEGDNLFVAPLFGQTLNCRALWIPQAAALTLSSTEVLNGKAESFGDAVTFCLAHLLNARQSGTNPAIERGWAEWQAKIAAAAKRTVGPKHVTYRHRAGIRW
jgi:hypothetical protein